MKKLLTILGAVVLGMGAAAQAQSKLKPVPTERMEQVAQKKFATSQVPVADVPQLKQGGSQYDTLKYGSMYVDPNSPCAQYTYYLSSQGHTYFTDEVVWNGWGTNATGGGEGGVSFLTKDNVYAAYSGHRLNEWEVVGAVAYVYREGSHLGWDKRGMPTGELYEGHVSPAEGEGVPTDELYPELPFIMKGYPEVASQPTFKQYLQNVYDITYTTMPLTLKGASETEVGYVPMGERRQNQNGILLPRMYWRGGLFDKPFPADNDFGISFQALLTGNARYDSLWNYGLGAKDPSECTEVDYQVSWVRLDARNPQSYTIFKPEYLPMDVSDVEEGMAPEGCPQHDMDSTLFINVWSWMGAQDPYLPALYPIIQRKTAANESNDAYAKTISVYPVPATDKVNLLSVDPMQRVELYNMAGSLLKHITLNENVAELDVTDMVPGTYVVRIVTEKGVASKKVLVR